MQNSRTFATYCQVNFWNVLPVLTNSRCEWVFLCSFLSSGEKPLKHYMLLLHEKYSISIVLLWFLDYWWGWTFYQLFIDYLYSFYKSAFFFSFSFFLVIAHIPVRMLKKFWFNSPHYFDLKGLPSHSWWESIFWIKIFF